MYFYLFMGILLVATGQTLQVQSRLRMDISRDMDLSDLVTSWGSRIKVDLLALRSRLAQLCSLSSKKNSENQ